MTYLALWFGFLLGCAFMLLVLYASIRYKERAERLGQLENTPVWPGYNGTDVVVDYPEFGERINVDGTPWEDPTHRGGQSG